MKIGNQIKTLRIEKGVKQEELADYLGVSFQAVSKWETGASVPDISLLPELAVYFGITIDELFQMPNETQFERIENMFWRERRINPETFEHSIHFLEGVLKEEPENVRACSDLAYLYNHRAHSDHELASDYAKKAMELKPEEKDGWVPYLEANGGVCGDEWYDNHFTVIQYFKQFVEKHPKNHLGLYAIIENLLADGWYQEAVPYIEQIKEVAKNYQYEMYTGDVAFGMGDKEKAVEYWNQAVEHYPDRWQAYCMRGDRLKKLGRYEEAIADFEHCVSMQESPRIYDGLCSLAQIHEQLGQYAMAIEDYRRIIKVLKEEYKVTGGESIEQNLREIERLKKLCK